jgi:hypothetical protein
MESACYDVINHIVPGTFPGGKGRPAIESDNFIAICEPIV